MLRPRELVILFALGAMEAMSSLALLIGIGFVGTSGPFIRPPGLLLLAAFAGVVASLVAAIYGRSSLAGRLALPVGAALAVVAPAFLSTPTLTRAAALLLALGVIYWRGISVVMAEPDAEDIVFRFSMGLGVFVIGCVVVTARGMMFQPRVADMLTVSGVLFVLAALTALAASSLQRSAAGGGVASSIAALGILLGSVAGLAILSFAVVTSDIGGVAATILSPVWDAITHGMAVLLTFLLSPLFALIERTHFRLPRMPILTTPNTLGHRVPTPTTRPVHHVAISHSTDVLLAALVIGLAVLLLGFIIWRTASSIELRRRSQREEERASMEWSPSAIWSGILSWFRGLFRGTVDAAVVTVQRVRSRIAGPTYPSDPVRRVYAQVLYRASINGLARPAAATPLEFQHVLSTQWPDGASDFAAVTDAYIRRRYGEMASGQEEVIRLREHWQHLRTVMRRPKTSS